MGSNPFIFDKKSSLPVPTKTDYLSEHDKYIIDYAEVEHVKMIGDKDTDFVKSISVDEYSRIDRNKYIQENSNEVGILNILKKMALSGDVSLLNQTHRASLPGSDKDALGRPVEDLADYTAYSGMDRVEALEKFKEGVESFKSLDEGLKGNKSLEEVAKLSDADIDAYIKGVADAARAQIEKLKEGGSE